MSPVQCLAVIVPQKSSVLEGHQVYYDVSILAGEEGCNILAILAGCGCWKYTGHVGTASLYFHSPHEHLWVHVDSSPPLSCLTPTLSATEVSHIITTQKPSLTCIVPES